MVGDFVLIELVASLTILDHLVELLFVAELRLAWGALRVEHWEVFDRDGAVLEVAVLVPLFDILRLALIGMFVAELVLLDDEICLVTVLDTVVEVDRLIESELEMVELVGIALINNIGFWLFIDFLKSFKEFSRGLMA